MRSATRVMAGFILLILCGCSDYIIPAPEYPEGIPENVSYSGDVQPIFDKDCAACHTGGQTPDLSPDWSYDELTGGGFINTDNPLESTIYQIFSGSHDGRASEDEVLVILGWIIEGAPNN